MPTVFIPEPAHSCLRDSRFEPDLNKATDRRVVGEIWQCPECGNFFRWDGDERATVPHPYWSQISKREFDRTVKRYANALPPSA